MNWKPISPFVQEEFAKYEQLRPIYASEGHFLNEFLWEHYYQTKYATDELALYLIIGKGGKKAAFPPLCKSKDLPEVFRRLEQYFHDELHEKLTLYLADAPTLQILTDAGCLTNYEISPDRDSYDYLYDADKLRTLSGKAMHKKKNQLNGFLREYEGRFQYESLDCRNIKEILAFHEKWLDERRIYDKYNCIDDEEDGIHRLFSNCSTINCRLGGVRIDGELKAYTVGSYAPDIQCVFVHVEKADINYKGLYNYINQQFIIHEFPDAKIVNREDDLGQDNLRQAKLSYRPLRLEEKYTLSEKP